MAINIRNSNKLILSHLRDTFRGKLRHLSNEAVRKSAAPEGQSRSKMRGWQIHSYGNLDELQLTEKMRIPTITSSNDVLIRVEYAGVNPIDVAMVGGYGAKFLKTLKCNKGEIEFPLVLGREFSGTVVQRGMGCARSLDIGDKVFGVVPVHQQGCHAEYVTVHNSCVATLPSEITPSDASAVLYAGLTAWSGLYISGLLGGIQGALTSQGGGRGKRVLVLGAAGGVGSMAVQILRAEHVTVVASCSTDAVPIVSSLGVQHVIDYTKEDEHEEFVACGPYDIILDCAGQGAEYAHKFNWKYKDYVTFSSPLLKNIDEHGLSFGAIKNLLNVIEQNTRSLTSNRGCIKWGYFLPAPHGIEYLKKLIERKKLLPVIDSCFKFSEADKAYQKVKDGHLRGKVIIDIENA